MYANLLEYAKKASLYSYSPYSKFAVGAALLMKNGKIYTGCNIENDGLQSICAERVAFLKAISEGEFMDNPENFEAIMIISRQNEKYGKSLPCGYCRQFMSEFTNNGFKVLTAENDKIIEYTISELLPHTFRFKEEI